MFTATGVRTTRPSGASRPDNSSNPPVASSTLTTTMYPVGTIAPANALAASGMSADESCSPGSGRKKKATPANRNSSPTSVRTTITAHFMTCLRSG
jgi:hypothetical protein